jgi:hypothetical protein
LSDEEGIGKAERKDGESKPCALLSVSELRLVSCVRVIKPTKTKTFLKFLTIPDSKVSQKGGKYAFD